MRHIRLFSALLACASPLCAQAPQPSAAISAQALDRAAPDMAGALADARPVTARHAMVVSDQHLATEVGVKILKAGGNAVDAAVAVGYALAVTDPCCGNIGGGGFMLIHLAGGRNLFLDFREKAPGKATATLFQDAAGNVIPDESVKSWRAIGVPGTVMGLNEALARYGTMSRKRVMAPAIALAKRGFVLVPGDVKIFASRNADFAKEPNVAAIFLNKGQPWRAGERLVQARLART
ncbi:MAG TPA: gamma-glutamyltransferase, partial [Sphingomonas sp.]